MKENRLAHIMLSFLMSKLTKRITSFILALAVLLTGISNMSNVSAVENDEVTIYFIDNSEGQWVRNDNAQMVMTIMI